MGVRPTGSLLGVSLTLPTVPRAEGTPGCLERLLLGRPVEGGGGGRCSGLDSRPQPPCSGAALGRAPSQIISAAARPPLGSAFPKEELAFPQASCA